MKAPLVSECEMELGPASGSSLYVEPILGRATMFCLGDVLEGEDACLWWLLGKQDN